MSIDHLKNCAGNLTCKVCGRRGCTGCIYTGQPGDRHGKCLVCAGTYHEGAYILHPVPNRDWDTIENKR
jgi:hypothetical protein